MAQKTNLNISPYYDDFDAAKNFYKVLFKPGVPVQARELTTLQSILQNQFQSFGSNIFKDGSVVIPGNITYDPEYYAVKINKLHLGLDVEFYVDQLIGKKITGETSQISAIVQNVVNRVDSEVNTTTLYVKYLGSNSNFEISTFISGETLVTQDTFKYGNTTITSGSTIASLVETDATSIASAVSISAGIYFIRGFFANVNANTIILDQYSNTPSYRVGLEIDENIVTSNEDSSLYDNAKGFANYSAPGSDRLQIGTTLIKKSLEDYDDKNFIEILRITKGEVKKIKDTSDYSLIKEYLAKRTYEESGNYSIKPFEIDVVDSLNNLLDLNGLFLENEKTNELNTPSENLLNVKISSGKAYVNGFDIEKSGTTILDVKKPRETKEVMGAYAPFEMGNLIIVNNVEGSPAIGIDNNYTVNLHNQRKSNNIVGQGTTIGKARVYSFSISDSAYQDSSTRWNLYLYDVQTYTTLTLNNSITSTDCPDTSYIKGLSSGASGYVVGLPSQNNITLTQTSGSFIQGEQVSINGNTQISRSISSVKVYGSQDIKSIYQDSTSLSIGLSTDFSVDTFLERKVPQNFNLTDTLTITPASSGVSTATSAGKNFVGIKSDTIIRYKVTGFSTESYNRVLSVSSDGLSIRLSAVPNVTGVCVGDIPTTTITNTTFSLGIPSIKNDDKSFLYSKLGNNNIANVNLSGSQLTITKQVNSKGTSSLGSLSLSITSDFGIVDGYFEPFDTERYSIFYGDGTVEQLTSDKVSITSNGTLITFSGLKTSQSGNVSINATITKNIIKNKKKLYNRSLVNVVNKTALGVTTSLSGLVSNKFYGLRVEDQEISLNVPDVVKILAVYESLDSSEVTLDKLTFSSGLNLNTNAIIGEKIIGSNSGSIGQIVTTSSTETQFVYLNSHKFQPGETVKFSESKISGSITQISIGSYLNRTQDFTLDKGQKEQYYDYSRIIRKVNTNIPSRKLTIVYDQYSVPSNDNGDVYTVNSYDQERYKNDIPLLKNGIRSSDTLDFRPRVSTFTSDTSSPFAFSSRNFASAGINPTLVVSPNESSSVEYSYYVPRIDRLILNKNGNFVLMQGTSSLNPRPPASSQDSMDVATISIPAYLYDVNDVQVSLVENKRYTMKDIGKLEDRISNLENLASLSLLELDTKSLQITDKDNIPRFKSGFFVDNFKGTEFIDVKNPDSKVTIKKDTEELMSDISLYSLKCKLLLNETINPETADFSTNLSLLDSNIKKTGDLVTLNYSEIEWGDVSQIFATKEEMINSSSGLTDYSGFVKLRPSSDTWVRTINTSGDLIIRSQGEWYDDYINNLISSTEPFNKMRSRNVEFTAGNLSPLTKYYSSLDSKSDIDIIPKLLQITMISGSFQAGEIVEGYVNGNKLACFRIANIDHKFGQYNNPSEVYAENPYVPTTTLITYSPSSTVLNIDTYSLADDADGRFYGYITSDMVLVGKTSYAQATANSQTLISDSFGDLIGSFYIRNPLSNPIPTAIFNVGTKIFKLASSSNIPSSTVVNYCETSFYASGIVDSNLSSNTSIIRKPIISKSFKSITKDPLTQTFRTDNSGGFLSSIDLFFAQKDDKEKLTIEIKEVDIGGYPTNKVVQDFARVQVSPTGIKTSADGEIATNVKLPSLLYLEPNKQYAIALNSPSSKNYKVWIAESNKPTVTTQKYPNAQQIIYSNQYVGGNLYKPQNGTASISSPFEDLKFKFYKANFSSTSGTVYFTNPDLSRNDVSDNYDHNIEKLVTNPITMYPRKLVVGILTSYTLSNILTVGRKVSERTTYGFVEQVGGNILGITTTNVGLGYSNGTFYNVPLYKIGGLGQNNATANVTFANGSLSQVSIANTGNGYVVGDLLGITTSSVVKGKGATITVSNVPNIDTLYLTSVNADSFEVNYPISYYSNGTSVSLAGTIVKTASYVPNDLYKGDVIKVHQYNHGMHSGDNLVALSGIFPDTSPEKLTSSVTSTNTTISVANTSQFANFENMAVSGVNTGYVLINNEVISYYSIGSGTLSILKRGENGSTPRNHSPNDLVYKYETNGVSITRINTTFNMPNSSSLLSSLKDIDDYYLRISRTDRETGPNQLNFLEQKTVGQSNCKATQNYQYNSIIPQFNTILPENTKINSSIRTISGTSSGGSETSFLDKEFEPVTLNKLNNLTTPRIICSKINETNKLSFMPKNKSLILGVNLSTSDSNVSPVVDVSEAATFVLSRNRINNPVLNYIDDSRSNQLVNDPHSSTYISNKVTLLKPATSIRVITNVYRNSSADFRILYKLFRSDSSEIDQTYQLFPGYNNLKDVTGDGIGDVIIDSSLNDGSSDIFVAPNKDLEFSEYQFTAHDLEQFTGFVIKIVMSGTNESYPLKFQDLRVIALA